MFVVILSNFSLVTKIEDEFELDDTSRLPHCLGYGAVGLFIFYKSYLKLFSAKTPKKLAHKTDEHPNINKKKWTKQM